MKSKVPRGRQAINAWGCSQRLADVESSVRTSSGTFLRATGDPVLERIEERIAAWAQIPVEHGEPFYLLRYEIGQYYKVCCATAPAPLHAQC